MHSSADATVDLVHAVHSQCNQTQPLWTRYVIITQCLLAWTTHNNQYDHNFLLCGNLLTKSFIICSVILRCNRQFANKCKMNSAYYCCIFPNKSFQHFNSHCFKLENVWKIRIILKWFTKKKKTNFPAKNPDCCCTRHASTHNHGLLNTKRTSQR